MPQPWYQRLSEGLARTTGQLRGHLNVLFQRGPDLDDGFWEGLEDALLQADMGVTATTELVDRLRQAATREALPDADAVLSRLAAEIAREVDVEGPDPFDSGPKTVLVVGVNGTGKTTSVGKIARQAA
jgi:fused signal recognition particle receptor